MVDEVTPERSYASNASIVSRADTNEGLVLKVLERRQWVATGFGELRIYYGTRYC